MDIYSQQQQVQGSQQQQTFDDDTEAGLNLLASLAEMDSTFARNPEVMQVLGTPPVQAPAFIPQQQAPVQQQVSQASIPVQQQAAPQGQQQADTAAFNQQVAAIQQQQNGQPVHYDVFGRAVQTMDGLDAFMSKSTLFNANEGAVDYEKINIDNLHIVAAKKFGIDTTKPDWIKSFVKGFDSTRKNASQAGDFKAQLENYSNNLQALPVELRAGIDTFLSGAGDWKEAMERYTIDTNRDYDKMSIQEKLTVVKKLAPNVIIPDNASEADVNTKNLLAIGKQYFEGYKQKVAADTALLQQQANDRKAAFDIAVNQSIGSLTQQFPDEFDDSAIAQIKSVIASSKGSPLFYSGDKLRIEAAQKAALALYGESILEKARLSAKVSGGNERVAELLSRNQTQGVQSTQSYIPTGVPQQDGILLGLQQLLTNNNPY